MIPPDVASRLQVSADAALRPVAPTQEIADKLSDLVAGQRVMASIQALLPNGTYRAMINQRSITLALPFSAKAGDSLELQVTESDGKLALAVVSRSDGSSANSANESVSATLSRTGQLISNLFSGARQSGSGPVALPLNGNQPIINAPPGQGQDLLPLLKQAIAQSGMFYESHQAEWVEGRLPKNALLQEPQGKLSSPAAFVETAATPSAAGAPPAENLAAGRAAAEAAPTPQTAADTPTAKNAATQATNTGQLIAPQTQAIVQQQLEALASQTFSWMGQVWPGQEMRWEIEEDGRQNAPTDEDNAANWRTSLRLTLPRLGGVDAQIRLQGEQLIVSIATDRSETGALMRSESETLRSQLTEAGLALASFGVSELATGNTDGQAAQ